MTKPDSTDAGGVTHEEARAHVRKFRGLGLDFQRDELSRYIDAQESALATLTGKLADMTSRAETAESKAERLEAALAKPATPPAPLPGGQGQVEALRREIAKAARRASHRGYIRDDGQNALQALAEELEQGSEGREGLEQLEPARRQKGQRGDAG